MRILISTLVLFTVMLRELYIVVDLKEQSWTFGIIPKM